MTVSTPVTMGAAISIARATRRGVATALFSPSPVKSATMASWTARTEVAQSSASWDLTVATASSMGRKNVITEPTTIATPFARRTASVSLDACRISKTAPHPSSSNDPQWRGQNANRRENRRNLAFTAPDGRALPPEPPREMVDDTVAFLRERAADQGLELGAETNLPEWDANVVDYDWAVGAMIGMG